MRRLSRVVSTVASVAVIGLVAGCGGDNPTPSAAPSAAASSSTKTMLGTSAPPVPARARRSGDDGAESFGRHYVALINYATTTGETDALSDAAAPTCRSCNSLATRIARVYEDGGSIESDGWKVTGVVVVPGQPAARKYLDLAIRQPRQEVIATAGAKVQRFPGGNQALSMTLRYGSGAWVVTSLTLANR